MTDGMKSGAGGDPFADESTDDDDAETSEATDEETGVTAKREANTGEETNSPQNRADRPDSSTDSRGDSLPYLFGRNGVKDDRKMVQYFLRDETEALEAEVKHAVEQEIGTDVYLTDVREALVCVGANHIEEVADELREWGYRYEEDTS